MTKRKTPPAFWIAILSAFALATIAILNPPQNRLVQDLDLPQKSANFSAADTL